MARRGRYRGGNRGRYRMTPKRRAALRKAQLASARKRKRSVKRKVIKGAGISVVAATTAGGGYAGYRHKASGSSLYIRTGKNREKKEYVKTPAHPGHYPRGIRVRRSVRRHPIPYGHKDDWGAPSAPRRYWLPDTNVTTITLGKRINSFVEINYRHRKLPKKAR